MGAVSVCLVVYAVLGVLGIRRWRRRHPVPVPNMPADPARWRGYWLPLSLVFELWALGATGLVCLLVQHSPLPHDQWSNLGILLGIVLVTVVFVGMDILLVVTTAKERQRR